MEINWSHVTREQRSNREATGIRAGYSPIATIARVIAEPYSSIRGIFINFNPSGLPLISIGASSELNGNFVSVIGEKMI